MANVSMQALIDQAKRIENTADAAVVVFKGVQAQLVAALAAGNDPVAIQQIADGLGTHADTLAQAIATPPAASGDGSAAPPAGAPAS